MQSILALLKTRTLRDTFISFIGLGATAFIGFIYTVILARHLGPSVYGVYSAVTALSAIIFGLGDLGITSSLINFLPKLPERRQSIINTSFIFQLSICFLSLILFFVFAIFQGAFLSVNLVLLVVLIWSTFRDDKKSLWVAFAGGLILDISLAKTLGLSSLLLLLSSFLIILYRRRFDPSHFVFLPVFTFFLSILFDHFAVYAEQIFQ